MVSPDLTSGHQEARVLARHPARRLRVSMLVPLRRLKRAHSPSFNMDARSAAFACALIALAFFGIVLASTISRDSATSGVSRQSGWPTDTIEAWLRNMTVTRFGAGSSGDQPYVSPEGLAAPPP